MTERPIGPDQRDIDEVNSLNEKSRWSRLASSRVARTVTVSSGLGAIGTAAVIAAEAAQTAPPAVVRNVERQEELFIPRNSLLNPGLEIPRFVFNRQTRRIEIVGPLGWRSAGNADYHWRDGSGNGSPSSVSGSIVARESEEFGCVFEGGSWSPNGLVRIIPAKTYEFGYAAEHQTLVPGFVIGHTSTLTIFDRSFHGIVSIGIDPSTPPIENTYVRTSGLTFGPDGNTQWPDGASYVGVTVNPSVLASSGGCPDGETVGIGNYDDVYFGPPR